MTVTNWLSQESDSKMELLRSGLGINPFGRKGTEKEVDKRKR